MPANTQPIFTLAPNFGIGSTLTTAAADYDGTGANNAAIWTAGANGGFIEKLRLKPVSTNIATVARIYINNGSDHTTASNNAFYGEFSLPATTASANTANQDSEYPLNIPLPAGYVVYVGLGTTVANGWAVSGTGGNY